MAATGEDTYSLGLQRNKAWAQDTASATPDLFPTLAKGQSPQILWLGCSDSRCPETTLLGLQPGDVFVHRNIANVINSADLSSAAVLAFAVGNLKVKHVVVCGHTSCGGVAAALGNASVGGILDAWLAPLKRLRAENVKQWEKEGISADEQKSKLVQANVRASVKVVRENSVVVEAVKERGLQIHGVVYDVGSGHLEELDTQEGEEDKGFREGVFSLK
ncbi:uncharacterized protein KY384_004298 [Bacidia gigantensis]|uniref:uncharacterized protein n=1 Tax=Bacidia gigantensis TaxID=2732470 RepID=UPI001D054B37|nr:uncharacterized protein KY384_004298 [Bacidia gigantensis]KAG8530941.1 hypothetical protein KY384_004298 [Bacidia gigantensis]